MEFQYKRTPKALQKLCCIVIISKNEAMGDSIRCLDGNSSAPLYRGWDMDSQTCTVFGCDQFDTQYPYVNSSLLYCNFEWYRSNFCKISFAPNMGS